MSTPDPMWNVDTATTGRPLTSLTDDKTVVGSYTPNAAQIATDEKRSLSTGDGIPRYPPPPTTWGRFRSEYRDYFGEFAGTFILIMFGNGSVCQVLLANGEKGDYSSITWGWGIGVMLGALCGGKNGAAHMNPAVTFTSAVFRKFAWRKVPGFIIAQVLGAMLAAAIVFGNYRSAIQAYEGGSDLLTVPSYSENATAGIFSTYPAAFMTRTGMVFSEIIASCLLQFCVFALSDEGQFGAGPFMPVGLFFLIFGIGACFGWETGFAINPARDFGPRVVSAMAGYGSNVFRAGGWYFWIPVIVPFIGSLLGAFLYDLILYEGVSPINEPWFGLRKNKTDAQKNDSTWRPESVPEQAV